MLTASSNGSDRHVLEACRGKVLVIRRGGDQKYSLRWRDSCMISMLM